MDAAVRNVLLWTLSPPDFCGGKWTEADVADVMISKPAPVWRGYSDQDWYEKLLESRLRRALDGTLKRDPQDPTA